VKDLNEVPIPSGNLVLVALGEDESRERIQFTPLDDLLLDLGHRSAIEISVSRFESVGRTLLVWLTWLDPQSHRGRPG
jgi:hypothetical protein